MPRYIGIVNSFKYLGVKMNSKNNCHEEVKMETKSNEKKWISAIKNKCHLKRKPH